MHEHRSFLIIGSEAGDLLTLLQEGYEISHFRFAFEQGIDSRNGKASTRVYGGTIDLSLSQPPPSPLIAWGMKSRKYLDGAIVMLDYENVPVEKILFKNAACVEMEFDYVLDGADYSETRLSIQAKQLTVAGDIDFTNEWTEY